MEKIFPNKFNPFFGNKNPQRYTFNTHLPHTATSGASTFTVSKVSQPVVMVHYYKIYCSVLLAVALLPCYLSAQFRGGNDDGVTVRLATNQPLGRNIFLGGADDGINMLLASNQSLGRNIFKGGVDDGVSMLLASNQPLGQNIFKGGADDGTSLFAVANQPLGRNIFKGGADDGFNVSVAGSQPLGRNVFTGGVNDGWAMAFSANVPLPITLTEFSGQWQQNDALLFWKTTTEVNASHFELERSFDGRNFSSIQRIAAAGQSSTAKSYQYTDANVKKLLPVGITTVYYRLQSVDKNGAGTYSGVVMLRAMASNEVDYAVFPNPASNFVTITATGLPAVEGTYIRLADVNGKVLLLQKMTNSRQQVSVSAYPNGSYFLQLLNAEKVLYTQKIIIRK